MATPLYRMQATTGPVHRGPAQASAPPGPVECDLLLDRVLQTRYAANPHPCRSCSGPVDGDSA